MTQLKNIDGINTDGEKSMFILTILEKVKETRLKNFSRKCTNIIKDGKLSRSESYNNIYTTIQIKICSKK